ncbi:drug/metabolite transporter superfamily [Pisolithus marmoratus]|nr:drug/metabolite transporter superfamily [Pisolithus marmoratus]
MTQWGEYCGTIQWSVVQCVRNNVGLLFVMLAQLFASFMNVAVKLLGQLEPPVPALELMIVSMAIAFICCEIFMIAAKVPYPFLGPKGVRPLLACRGVAGFFGVFGIYYALQYLPLGDVTVLTFVGPIFTGIAGRLFLGETYSKREALASFCSLFGVVLIARPPFLFESARDPEFEEPVVNAATTFASVFTQLQILRLVLIMCISVIAIRAIGTRAHAMHSTAYFSLSCVVVSMIGLFLSGEPIIYPTQWQWNVLLLLIGVLNFAAQMYLTMGLQRETAARGTIGVYVQVIFADVLDVSFFKTVPNLLSFLGTGIIMTCAIYIVVSQHHLSPV